LSSSSPLFPPYEIRFTFLLGHGFGRSLVPRLFFASRDGFFLPPLPGQIFAGLLGERLRAFPCSSSFWERAFVFPCRFFSFYAVLLPFFVIFFLTRHLHRCLVRPARFFFFLSLPRVLLPLFFSHDSPFCTSNLTCEAPPVTDGRPFFQPLWCASGSSFPQGSHRFTQTISPFLFCFFSFFCW